MASPQKENGSTMISNEVLESLYRFLSGNNEIRIILFIIRKTWGWHKKEDKISYGQISEATNIPRRNVIRVVNKLVAKKTLSLIKGRINTIRFNKNYDEWLVAKKTPVAKMTPPSGKKDTTLVSIIPPEVVSIIPPTKETKETIQKILIQKKVYSPPNLGEQDFIKIGEHYNLPLAFVRSEYEDMVLWCESNPTNPKIKGRNWYKTLMVWVKKDSIKRIDKSRGDPTKRGVDATNV